MDNLEFARRRVKYSTRKKISRALKGKGKKRVAAIGGAAGAIAGLGFIALKTKNPDKNKTGAMHSVKTKPEGLVGTNITGLLPSMKRGNEAREMPTTRLQTAQIEVVSKGNAASRAGEMAAKIPGAKEAMYLGQETRVSFEEGRKSGGSKTLTGLAGKAGKMAGRLYGKAKRKRVI